MKRKSEFNLEHSVRNWRSNLSKSHIMTTDNIEELESHLLDEIDKLKSEGLNDNEAFLMAVEQIGTKDFLVSEYSKVSIFNTIFVKCIPLLQCALFYFLLQSSFNVVMNLSKLGVRFFNLDFIETNTILITVFIIVLIGVMFFLMYYINNMTEKGKSLLRLIDNTPFFIGAFIFSWLANITYYQLIIKGMSISDYGGYVYQDFSLMWGFCLFILMMVLTTYLKLKRFSKKEIAWK